MNDIERKLKEFPYYLPIETPPRIAFGSCKERFADKVATNKTARRKQILKHFQAKPRLRCSTSLLKNYPSKRGYAGLASQTKRFQERASTQYPPPGCYDVEQQKPSTKLSYPFNMTATAPLSKCNTPAPSDHADHERRHALPVNMAFGTQRLVIPAVTVFCGLENKSKCFKCQCRPEGDYFHNFETQLDLCRRCMNAELQPLSNCQTDVVKRVRKLKELGKYKPARWCDFHHKHKGSKLIIKKYALPVLRKKITAENYLYSFEKMQKWYIQY